MVQSTLSAKPYRNEGLFNARYLDADLQGLDDWDCDVEARRALERIAEQFESEYDYVSGLGDNEEDETKDKWIKPVFEALGFDSKTETNLDGQRGEVDYSLFPSEQARQEADDEYDGAVTILEAKTWDADFSEKYSERRNYYSADYQIRYYLDYTPEHIQWGVLTNGRKWRLYATRELGAEVFYEVDLPELVQAWLDSETDDEDALTAFKYFYCFFRPDAFTATTDDSFLDRVYRGSDEARRALGEDLQDHVFDALTLVGQGFIDTNDLSVEGETVHLPEPVGESGAETITLGELKQQSMVYLYRLMFLLNAESQELIQPGEEPASGIYRRELSVYQLCEDVYEVADDPAAVGEQSLSESNTYWNQLRDLFRIIESGSEDLPITAYDGGLFDRAEHPFLESYQLSNRYVAEVLYLLSTTEVDGQYELVDYNQQGLGARHLGNIYEGLLEHRFAVADEERVAVTEDDSEVWKRVSEVSDPDPDAPRVAEGELYVVNDDAERKATGSYYTPDYVVEYIVAETVEPLIDEIESDLAEAGYEQGTAEYLAEFKSRVLDLKLVDPAMGSGHFLTEATAQLTDAVEAVAKESESAVDADVDAAPDDREYAPQQLKRDVAKECIYGVDKNAMAVELAKVSMWLETLSADQPLAFLDHHLKVGNSLVGSDVEEINGLETGEIGQEYGDVTTYGKERDNVIKDIVDLFEQLLSIQNETLEDAEEMKRIYHDEIQADENYRKIKQIANVHTAEKFGIDAAEQSEYEIAGVPVKVHEFLANKIDDDLWTEGTDDQKPIIKRPWFEQAQSMAREQRYFHWKLEFPLVFYEPEEDGDIAVKDHAGFDAVLSNPPYIPTERLSDDNKKYLTDEFEEILHRKYDLSVPFLQQSFTLTRQSGRVGMITPVSWETGPNYEKFRRHTFGEGDISLHTIVNLPFDVFPDAYVDTNVAVFGKRTQAETFFAKEFDKRHRITETAEFESGGENIPYEYLESETACRVFFTSQLYELIQQFRDNSYAEIGDVTESRQGIVKSFYDYSATRQSENQLPYRECDVYRYELTPTDEKYIFMEEDDSLRPFYTNPRILVRRLISRDDRLMATTTDDDFVVKKDLNPFLLSDEADLSLKYVLANLNSALHSYLYINRSAVALKDDYRQTTLGDLRELPIRLLEYDEDAGIPMKSEVQSYLEGEFDTSDPQALATTLFESASEAEVQNLVVYLVDYLAEKKEQTSRKNTDPESYLGGRNDGLKLTEIDGYQPPSGALSDVLTGTTEEYPELEIVNTKFQSEIGKHILYLKARYEPEESDDTVTTDWIPAMEFVGIDETLANLIREFVAYVTENPGGYEYRNNATKNFDLEKRLSDIQLPRLSRIEQKLNTFVQNKTRVSELNEQASRADALVDEIVYELYDLSEEQRELVEQRFAEDR